MMDRRGLMAGLAAGPLVWATGAGAQSDSTTPLSGIEITAPRVKPVVNPYTIEELFRPAPALDAALSPDGSKVALLIDVGPEDARQTEVLVFSADDPSRGEARFTMGDTNTHWLRWAGDRRIMVGVSGSSPTELKRRTRSFSHPADRKRELPYRRIMVMSLDGKPPVQLFQPAAGPNVRIPPEQFRRVLNLSEVIAVPDGDTALMAAFDREDLVVRPGKGWAPSGAFIPGPPPSPEEMTLWDPVDAGAPLSTMRLFRLNLATGEPREILDGTERTYRWEAQGGEAILRRDIGKGGQTEVWRVRPTGGGAWKEVRTVSRADPDIIFMAASDRPRELWVLARQPGETMRSVRLWDIEANTLSAPVSARPDREPVTVLFAPDGAFLLASYRGAEGLDHDTPDANLKSILLSLAVHFGQGAAVRVMHVDASRTKLLTEVSGPQQPRAYYLFDSARRRLADIGGGARLVPDRLADAAPVSMSRSGEEPIGGVLTGSLDGSPGPLVVILQSAAVPESLYTFDPMAQVFATRGWWTLRTVDSATPAEVEALAREAVRVAALDPSRLAIFGQGSAGQAALAQLATGSWKAGVVFDSPTEEGVLLAGASIGQRGPLGLQAVSGGKPVLVIRNWRDSRNARQTDQRVANAFLQNDLGGIADALALGESGDADWNKLSTQVERARLVADFLARAFA